MLSRLKKMLRYLIFVAAPRLLFLIIGCCGCVVYADGPNRPEESPSSQSHRVSFVQMTAPHLFDAGLDRQGEGVEEEALDNRAAFHWAVLETNRLLLAEHRTIDFVVITGGFGLRNVLLPTVNVSSIKKCNCPKRIEGKEGPIAPVTLIEAAAEAARELDALEVKRIYLIPGRDDLCDESPTDLHRWAAFVWELNAELKRRHDKRESAIRASYPASNGNVQVRRPPLVVDLTFTLERLHAANDPSVDGLFTSGSGTARVPDPPVINGISLLGLDSAYFGSHENMKIQTASDKESAQEFKFLQERIIPGGSYLIFTYTADVRDTDLPSDRRISNGKRSMMPRPSSADRSPWSLPKQVRQVWDDTILPSSQVIAIFGGHFYSSKRELYPHNFSSLKPPPEGNTSSKTWLAPPLAAENQWTLPPEKTARGILFVTVNGNGAIRASIQSGEKVDPVPIWFSTLDQKAAVEGDDKLVQARAQEIDGHWDEATKLYGQALNSGDSRVRASATRGYERASEQTRTWWWQLGKYLPPIRWAHAYPWRAAWVFPILLGLLAAFAFLRWLRFLYIGRLTKFLLIPRYQGRVLLHATTAMTKDAPTDEFNAQMLAAQQEIRARLLSEQESWLSGHVALLAPSSASFDSLVSSIPKAQQVDFSGIVKFLVQVARAFQWTVDSGLAVFPPDATPPTVTPGTTPATLPPGGELSAYAVLQWAWLTKNSWRRKVPINDHSAVRDLARQLAELILGEAFV